MRTTMSEKGQVVIPGELRRKYGWRRGEKFLVRDVEGAVLLVPLPRHPLLAWRGRFAGHDLTGSLLALRDEERRREGER